MVDHVGRSVNSIRDLYSPLARRGSPGLHGVPEFPIRINFDQGLPDPRYFPLELIKECVIQAIDEDGPDALKYFGAGGAEEMLRGYVGLRREIAAWIAKRDGKAPDVDGVLLVNGSTDGLALAVKAFLGPGDGAITEAATYPPTKTFMNMTGADVRTVPIDDDGMVVDELPRVLEGMRADGVPPKLIYTVPTFQAPTGTVMSCDRRERLIEIAAEWGVIVLEDNCYYAFDYDDKPPPTLLALDHTGYVLQSDSFSKYVAPGLRMAWAAGHPDAIEAMVRVRQDFAVSQLLARAVERYIRAGYLDSHLDSLRSLYKTKRDLTAAALAEHCQGLVTWRVPSGGFYFWLEISPDVDWELARHKVARSGVAYRPGDGFVGDDSGRKFVRISSIQVREEDIEPGIVALADALRESMTTTTTRG
jgi:2-aminoadipate transaminase